MLVYEHVRTEKIVERLRAAETGVRRITVTAATFAFAAIGFSAAGVGSSNVIAIAGIAGGVIGFVLGICATVLLSAVIEWMCQLLIAQGALLEQTGPSRAAANS
jgi:hypothetical protein